MPGSPSLGGRKPGILSSQLVTYKGPEGSNPSPGVSNTTFVSSFSSTFHKRQPWLDCFHFILLLIVVSLALIRIIFEFRPTGNSTFISGLSIVAHYTNLMIYSRL